MAVAVTDSDGNTFAVGLRELKTKSAADMLSSFKEVLADIDGRIEATQPKDGENPKQNHVLLKGIRATMSDRASTQKLLNEHIEELVNEVIPQLEAALPHLEPEDAEVVIVVRNYYCGIHYVVHFADVMSKGANEAELAEFDGNPPSHPSSFAKNPKEASGVALIRKACKAFAAGGCEKYGCYGKAKLFLEPILKEKFDTNTILITPF